MVKMSDALKRGGRSLGGEEAAQPAKQPAAPARQPAAQKAPAKPQVQAKPKAPAKPQAPAEPKVDADDAAAKKPLQQAPKKKKAAKEHKAAWAKKVRDRESQERLVSFFAPSSLQAKRIDILRTQLLFPFHGAPPRTVMVTSSVPQEGKSLLTANLAISIARGLQQFVMIMDCHLFNPTIHELLELPRKPGLTDYLEHGAGVPDIMHWSQIDKLSVIPAGSPSRRSAEILATDRMSSLIAELRSRYKDRYILLDTPPVQAVDDPQVLARVVEGIIFVVLSGSTDREVVMRSLARLPEEKVMGVVLNDKLSSVTDAATLSAPALKESSV